MPRSHPPYAPEYRRRIVELARAAAACARRPTGSMMVGFVAGGRRRGRKSAIKVCGGRARARSATRDEHGRFIPRPPTHGEEFHGR